mmetsp:Transcript_35963/g.78786  ORF Transcript_35963/g.78786 Transcript_35963/m.78786 type:complete len:218 (-) Transcript_35963:850-1503(-)
MASTSTETNNAVHANDRVLKTERPPVPLKLREADEVGEGVSSAVTRIDATPGIAEHCSNLSCGRIISLPFPVSQKDETSDAEPESAGVSLGTTELTERDFRIGGGNRRWARVGFVQVSKHEGNFRSMRRPGGIFNPRHLKQSGGNGNVARSKMTKHIEVRRSINVVRGNGGKLTSEAAEEEISGKLSQGGRAGAIVTVERVGFDDRIGSIGSVVFVE